MKAITISILFISMLFCINKEVYAQDNNSHIQAVEELLLLFDMDELLSQSIDAMINVQQQRNPELVQFEDVMKDFFSKYMGWNVLRNDFITLYVQEFSEQEIRDLIKFYQTSTGQKAIKKLPTLMSKGAEIGQKNVQKHLPELQEMIMKRINELDQK